MSSMIWIDLLVQNYVSPKPIHPSASAPFRAAYTSEDEVLTEDESSGFLMGLHLTDNLSQDNAARAPSKIRRKIFMVRDLPQWES